MDAKFEIKTEDFYCRSRFGDNISRLECSPHLHYSIEFFLLLEGETVAYVDSVEYRVSAGEICMVFPNQIHQFKSLGDEKYILVIVNPDIFPEVGDIFIKSVPEEAVVKSRDVSDKAKQILLDLASVSDGPYRDIIIKGLLLSFFGLVFREKPLVELKAGNSHALKTVVNYCSRNFSLDLSLDFLEKQLHISKYYISHLFSQTLGIRFNDYINSLRVTDACRQLKTTDKTVTEISEYVGFNTLRTFNRAFVKQTGMSPSEYRKAAGQNSLFSSSIII